MNSKNWLVYQHTLPNGKVYVGITKRKVNLRWNRGNGYKTCPKFYNAICKYGWNNIKHEILFYSLDAVSAAILEIAMIKHYKGLNLSLNITNGGQGQLGIRRFNKSNPFYKHNHSKESIEKIKLAQVGSNNSMFGTKAPIAIKVNNKYLTEYAKELNVSYRAFYLYYIRHGRSVDKTVEFYNNKLV
jgi:hypothetical protein